MNDEQLPLTPQPEPLPEHDPVLSHQLGFSTVGKAILIGGLGLAAFNIAKGAWQATDADHPQPFIEHSVGEVLAGAPTETTPAENGLLTLATVGSLIAIVEGHNITLRAVANRRAEKAKETKQTKDEDN